MKLLIANRGEIARRVIATARRLGVPTVAVYSDADTDALHVADADEAVRIGGALPAESYLDIDAILAAAARTGATAIHPGYGFLSENARFAAACAERGIVFVGPPVGAIEAMGSKSAAKAIMEQAGVPLLPGYHGERQDDELLAGAADEIGYPVLLKAAAGGGGKGMRVVEHAAAFDGALAAARREAQGAFGDDRMLVEKYLLAPRHVELQVFADTHGHVVHVFDRDCSIQRRHQKIVEEAPAPGLGDALRAAMAQAAIDAARAIDYVGAGTVEFLVDGDDFYFMEMNTRLQVEHPVTEMIAGVDLVEWQLRVAAGEPLPCTQDELHARGHAIEARLYAEDADGGFLPTSGVIDGLVLPATSAQLRLDIGVRDGDAVGVYYDPMIGKLIAHGDDREAARRRLVSALDQLLIGGLVTNIAFLRRVLASDAFAATELDTRFIEHHGEAIGPTPAGPHAVALAAWLAGGGARYRDRSAWQAATAWRMNHANVMPVNVQLDAAHAVGIEFDRAGQPSALHANDEISVLSIALDGTLATVTVDGHSKTLRWHASGLRGVIVGERDRWTFAAIPPDTGEADERLGDGSLRAPMTGRVTAVAAAVGDRVSRGDALVVLEAMKMEHTLSAPFDGTVSASAATEGALVEGGSVLMHLQPDSEGDDGDA